MNITQINLDALLDTWAERFGIGCDVRIKYTTNLKVTPQKTTLSKDSTTHTRVLQVLKDAKTTDAFKELHRVSVDKTLKSKVKPGGKIKVLGTDVSLQKLLTKGTVTTVLSEENLPLEKQQKGSVLKQAYRCHEVTLEVFLEGYIEITASKPFLPGQHYTNLGHCKKIWTFTIQQVFKALKDDSKRHGFSIELKSPLEAFVITPKGVSFTCNGFVEDSFTPKIELEKTNEAMGRFNQQVERLRESFRDNYKTPLLVKRRFFNPIPLDE